MQFITTFVTNFVQKIITKFVDSLNLSPNVSPNLVTNSSQKTLGLLPRSRISDTTPTMTKTKIPSEMEVAPPHKRFIQFSALIKLKKVLSIIKLSHMDP